MTDMHIQDESQGTYELTYLVRDEKDVTLVRSFLDRFQGNVLEEDALRKVQLSYPIRKELFAFMGVIVFQMEKSNINELSTASHYLNSSAGGDDERAWR